MYKIQYKTKVKNNGDIDYINYKKELSRSDCNIEPSQHKLYNSDLFVGLLNRLHKKATMGRAWCNISKLPDNVSVDTTGFLAIVTVTIDNDRYYNE